MQIKQRIKFIESCATPDISYINGKIYDVEDSFAKEMFRVKFAVPHTEEDEKRDEAWNPTAKKKSK